MVSEAGCNFIVMAASLPLTVDDCLYCIYDWKNKCEEERPKDKHELNQLRGDHERECKRYAQVSQG